eukprot:5782639-Amphidinium_carterae.1
MHLSRRGQHNNADEFITRVSSRLVIALAVEVELFSEGKRSDEVKRRMWWTSPRHGTTRQAQVDGVRKCTQGGAHHKDAKLCDGRR